MRVIRHAAATLAALFTVGCYTGGSPASLICTDVYLYGLTVEVRDAGTLAPIADGATLTITEGSYVETVTDAWDGTSFAAAGERPGTYEVRVTKDGYQPWVRSGVLITGDECHVTPRNLEARLEPVG